MENTEKAYETMNCPYKQTVNSCRNLWYSEVLYMFFFSVSSVPPW
jgi:hypothetical protein